MSIRHTLLVAACALVLANPAAVAQTAAPALDKWQSVARTDNQEAFVNAPSIVVVGGQLEAKVKQNFAQPQPAAKQGKSYLSSRTTYRFDCAQRRMAMKDVRAFVGSDLQGGEVQKATSSDKNLIWLDAAPKTVFGELLDYVCKATPAAPAG
jgi:hypothetical protein